MLSVLSAMAMEMDGLGYVANRTESQDLDKTTTRPHYTSSSSTGPSGPIFLTIFAESDWMYVYLVLQCLMGLLSISLNSVVFSFYWGHVMGENQNKKRNRVYYFLYVMLSLADMLRGLNALLHALVLGFIIHWTKSVIPSLCYVILILSTLSGHLSILLNVLISFLRTLHIVRPTLQIGPEPLLIPIVLYSALWAAISFADVYLLTVANLAGREENIMLYILIAPRIYCIFGFFEQDSSKKWLEYAFIAIGLPYILPTIICVVCACIQVISLVKMNVRSSANGRITVTIFILTICFFACNVPYFLYFCLSIDKWTSRLFMETSDTLVSYFVANFPGTINSIMNPMILLSRGRTLRRHLKSVIPVIGSFFPDTQLTREMDSAYITSRVETRGRGPVEPRELSVCPEVTADTCFSSPRVTVSIGTGNRVKIMVD